MEKKDSNLSIREACQLAGIDYLVKFRFPVGFSRDPHFPYIFGKLEEDFADRLLAKQMMIEISSSNIFFGCSEEKEENDNTVLIEKPMSFLLYDYNGQRIAHSCFSQLPGCCGVLVSHGLKVMPKFRRQGCAGLLHDVKEYLARRMGTGKLLCTVQTANEPEKNRLRKSGWVYSSSFHNPRSGNSIEQWEKILEPEKRDE